MAKNGHDWAISIYKNEHCIKNLSGKGSQHTKQSIQQAKEEGYPDLVVWYENPYLKATRQLWAGQKRPFARNNISRYLKDLDINCKWVYTGHHESHAAHFYNSPFLDASIIVIDSIGEWDTTSIWRGFGNKITKIRSVKYPHSIGLFYSSMTHRIGLEPQADEGKLEVKSKIVKDYEVTKGSIENELIKSHKWKPLFTRNMHKGIKGWRSEFYDNHIAAATQSVFEDLVMNISDYVYNKLPSRNLIISGGCGFNQGIRPLLKDKWDNVFFPKNPSDSGSAETCVLSYLRNMKNGN